MGEVTYVVDQAITDRAEAAAVCNAALDAIGPRRRAERDAPRRNSLSAVSREATCYLMGTSLSSAHAAVEDGEAHRAA